MSDLEEIQSEVDALVDSGAVVAESISNIQQTLADEKVLIDDNAAGVSRNKQDIEDVELELTELKTVAKSGSYNDLSDKPEIPSKTSQLDNDSGFITANDIPAGEDVDLTEVESKISALEDVTSQLKPVSTSGKYVDLEGLPTIPDKVSQLANDSGFITIADIPEGGVDLTAVEADIAELKSATKDLKTVASTGSYSDLSDKPTIPDKISQLNNDSSFITANDIPAPPTVPTKNSELENDSGFITGVTASDVTADIEGLNGANVRDIIVELQSEIAALRALIEPEPED